MVGFYSYNTPQIYAALKEAGQLGKITVVGFDGDPVTLGGVKEGSIAGTVVQQPFVWAYKGMKMMAAYLKGDKSDIPANGLDHHPDQDRDERYGRRLCRRSEGDGAASDRQGSAWGRALPRQRHAVPPTVGCRTGR